MPPCARFATLRRVIGRTLPLILLLLAGVLGVGCQATLRPYAAAPNPVAIDAREYDRVYAAAIDVLRDYGFRVDRQDHRFGVVTSHPLSSPTVGEPWYPQNTTLAQAMESTLNHVRRVVTVTLEPVSPEDEAAMAELAGALDGDAPETAPADAAPPVPSDPQTYLLRVEVVTENEQVPVRRLTMATQSDRYSNLDSVPVEWQERGITARYWLPTGRDPHLEQRLIRAIVERSLELPEPVAAATP